tara:strand:- start:1384 stop:2496 length:1113 start_codon:yes stop_codon:yes gene_type:complete
MPYNASKKGILNQPAQTANSKSAQGYYGVKDTFLYGKANEYPGLGILNGVVTFDGTEYKAGSTDIVVGAHGFKTFTVTQKSVVVDVKMWGAAGGSFHSNYGSYSGRGAAGGYTQARVTLPVGSYAFLIGEGGHEGGIGANNGVRAFPDGGQSGETSRSDGGGGGGGSTRLGLLTQGGVTLADSSTYDTTASFNKTAYGNYILIAGGGGGSCKYQSSDNSSSQTHTYGRGGGLFGGDGSLYYSGDTTDALGHGGTPSAGGAAGSNGRYNSNEQAGARYFGGRGAGGGGGGHYGGGGSHGYYAQAGGGSGYVDSSYCVAGQSNYTVFNGGDAVTTFHVSQVTDATFSTAGSGPTASNTQKGNDGAFRMTVVS